MDERHEEAERPDTRGRHDSLTRRRCAVTRAELAPADLIRFVAAPDGEIVPDLARRLPGRGVWVTATRDAVAEAARREAFARSLKRKVHAPPDLAARVETLLKRRLTEAFALANKAGLVATGFAQVEAAIVAGAAALAHAAEAAPGGREKLDRKFAAIRGVEVAAAPIVTLLSSEELSLAIGRSNVVHAALNHGGATERFLSEAERLRRYRSGFAQSVATAEQDITEV